jgi:integrase
MTQPNITAKTIRKLAEAPGKSISRNLTHGHGALLFRSRKSGQVTIYFRYVDQGKRVDLKLGNYDESGGNGLTLKEANQRASTLSLQHANGETALKEHLEAEQRAKNESVRKHTDGTFGQLLDAYVDALIEEEKESARQVRSLFKRWVKDKHPELLTRKANAIVHADIMDILILANNAGVKRTVNKLRSYLLAAFNKALSAEGDPSLASSISSHYEISVNPVATTVRVSRYETARDRTLNREELRELLIGLEQMQPMTRNTILLSIILGGQRPQQVLRLTQEDVDLDGGTIRLYDPKGRRDTPRIHILPIPKAAIPLLEQLITLNSDAPYLFTNDGKHPVSIDTVSRAVSLFAEFKYQLRDVRRTCETMLAEMGISKDLRAQIQSHGLSGVQDRHYDKYEYMKEKSNALEAWNKRIDDVLKGQNNNENVVPIHS